MKKEQRQMTFEIRIDHCYNSTWQGKLTAQGQTVEFQSELELIWAMEQMIAREEVL